MSKPGTPIRIWIEAAVVLGSIAIALMGVVIHLKASESSCAEDDESTLFEKHIPVFFRSEEQQKAMAAVMATFVVNHACCRSSQIAIKPTSAVTMYNMTVTVIQDVIINRENFSQYFYVEDCTESGSQCNCNCACQQREGYFPAYVKYPDGKLNISQIRLRASCKCVNT